MWKAAALVFTGALCAGADVRTMTLREAVAMAVRQNPDIALARLDEETARHAVQTARDPFSPRITVGSGLAYSSGFPMSTGGGGPSLFQANASQFLFNRQQSFAVAQAREEARAAGFGSTGKRDEVAYRTAALYLDAERAGRVGDLARRDAESLQKVMETVQAQVREGRALPLAEKQAAFNVARARQTAENLEADLAAIETSLALAVGLTAGDRVSPVPEERQAAALPANQEQALEAALGSNSELRKLQSQIAAKELEVRGERSARLPRVDLVAQYGLFAKFNHYEDYYRTFQRNNGQIGVSVQMPVFSGPGVKAQVAQTQVEIEKLKVQLAGERNRVSADLQAAFRDVKKAGTGAEVARLDLEVAREQLSVNLAQMQEGRLSMRQVEESRIAENGKWIAFYDAQYAAEKARWNVLRITGELAVVLDAIPAR